jgi:hypothetical protein
MTSFYQDRLGTDMGKVLETKTRFLQEDADSFDYVLLGGLLGAKSYSILYLSLLVRYENDHVCQDMLGTNIGKHEED